MDLNLQKEELSRAYVKAVAAVAGFATYRPSVDDDSIGLGVAARGGGGSVRSPRLELQIKCTSGEQPSISTFPFPLRLKNYEDLRRTNVLVPRVLVVVVVPEDVQEWLDQSEERLALRRCGYWLSLRGNPDTDNTTSVTVDVPRAQVFSVDALRSMMTAIGTGGAP